MKKIDGHAHIVNTIAGFNGKGRLNAIGDGYAIWDDGDLIKLIPNGYGDQSFTAEAFLKFMDANDVEKAVILQGHLNGYQNYYTHLAIKKYPERFTGAFSVDPFAENAMQIVQRHVETLGFRAIKFEISQGGGIHGYRGQKTPFRLDTDPHVSRILTYLLNYPGFVVTVDYGNWDQISHQPDAIANLARLYSGLDFVVCHLSFPHADTPNRLRAELSMWKDLDNVYTDISAIQDIDSPDQFPFPKSEQNVRIAKEVLGAKRIIWGTDSPWSATFNIYEELATWLEEVDIFSQEELEDVLYNNAERVYFKRSAIEANQQAIDPITKDLGLY
ncbi:amidohydrolase family protein [Streptococcus porcinus]|uniref:Amidohydrolase n=1 Tax=Streptococcus porcinus TaxID=1340 RepID=A0A7V9WQP8_STRPO|nr:amidohydrolase family protein [Streptococcus porcinus]MBA2795128.1 amidohydrolase [Streptococcus porcinus]